ncbi:MAG: PadR family transcriptional regulator [Thermoleophilia bacterium]|nr:PadR family transcriptional regulator [Thermoleophilia bacterium]
MGESRQSQLLRGVLDVCLLAVIGEEPVYGYEMTRRLRERGLAAVADGSIYPALARLQRDRLVEDERQAGNGGPPRKYYRLTPAGRAALAEWTGEWRELSSSIDRVLGVTERREL